MKMKQHLHKIFLAALLASGLTTSSSHSVQACEQCSMWADDTYSEMVSHEMWMTDDWWDQHLKKDFQKFTTAVRNAVIMNAELVGAALDGQNLMNTLRALEESNVETLKTYAPSESICRFGTLSRSLALSEEKGRVAQVALAERSQNRQMGHNLYASQDGPQGDFNARMKLFTSDFCDPADFGNAMSALCSGGTDISQNADINYTRTVDTKKTLDVDFTDTSLTTDEKNIIGLASNLYAHQVFDRIDVGALKKTNKKDSQVAFLDQRSIVAKRSVAENSFNALVGLKAKGGAETATYMAKVFEKLGLSEDAAKKYVGGNPSYDAQMEVLTKKIYQDPAFYVNLMDGPANVSRQLTAMQSFGLMQRRDIYETILRSEMLLSLLLEMEISKYQTELQNRSNTNE